MAAPNTLAVISRDGLTVDGQSLCAADEPIQVEHVADGLHILHVAIYVEKIEAEDPLIHCERSSTYTLVWPPRATEGEG
jgi:hypothetical protein